MREWPVLRQCQRIEAFQATWLALWERVAAFTGWSSRVSGLEHWMTRRTQASSPATVSWLNLEEAFDYARRFEPDEVRSECNSTSTRF